jgi:hypothetical protein
MKKSIGLMVGLLAVVFISTAVLAEKNTDPKDYPWKRGYLNLGYYLADLDSSVRFGEANLGIGLDIDVEELLGLDTSDSTFRIDAGYRFGKTRRHKVEFSWFSFDRSGSTVLDRTIDVPELPDGSGGGTIGPGQFGTIFNFDIYKLKYEYSFVFDDRVDLNLGAGLFIMPIEFGFTGTINGVGQTAIAESITAPLPVVGLGFDFAITPKWFIRQQADIFYLKIDNYEGSVGNLQFALEYLPWQHVGFGLGTDWMRVRIEGNNSDVPGVDFKGNVEFSWLGIQLYVKAFF